jgi:hypothetical protein
MRGLPPARRGPTACRSHRRCQPWQPQLGRSSTRREPGRPASGRRLTALCGGSPRVACRRPRPAAGGRCEPCNVYCPTRVLPRGGRSNGCRQTAAHGPLGWRGASGRRRSLQPRRCPPCANMDSVPSRGAGCLSRKAPAPAHAPARCRGGRTERCRRSPGWPLSRSRHPGRAARVGLPPRAIDGRRPRSVPSGVGAASVGPGEVRGRQPGRRGQRGARLVGSASPPGHRHPEAMAASGLHGSTRPLATSNGRTARGRDVAWHQAPGPHRLSAAPPRRLADLPGHTPDERPREQGGG